MKMYISNGNQTLLQMEMLNRLKAAPAPAPTQNKDQKSSLNSSMIGRIHNAKSGCGSCGKH